MARRVFFSFHYERDIWRVSQVRNSWLTKPDREAAGFWDAATREQIKARGNAAIKKWIKNNLKGTSVTVVLIGKETSSRRWVRYEIEESIAKGNDIIGVRIHQLRNKDSQTDRPGSLDFGLVDGEHTFSELFPVYDWVDDDGYENLGYWIEREEPAEEEFGFWDAVATIAIVAGLAGIVSAILKPTCPYCKAKVDRGTVICPNCGRYIKT